MLLNKEIDEGEASLDSDVSAVNEDNVVQIQNKGIKQPSKDFEAPIHADNDGFTDEALEEDLQEQLEEYDKELLAVLQKRDLLCLPLEHDRVVFKEIATDPY